MGWHKARSVRQTYTRATRNTTQTANRQQRRRCEWLWCGSPSLSRWQHPPRRCRRAHKAAPGCPGAVCLRAPAPPPRRKEAPRPAARGRMPSPPFRYNHGTLSTTGTTTTSPPTRPPAQTRPTKKKTQHQHQRQHAAMRQRHAGSRQTRRSNSEQQQRGTTHHLTTVPMVSSCCSTWRMRPALDLRNFSMRVPLRWRPPKCRVNAPTPKPFFR